MTGFGIFQRPIDVVRMYELKYITEKHINGADSVIKNKIRAVRQQVTGGLTSAKEKTNVQTS